MRQLRSGAMLSLVDSNTRLLQQQARRKQISTHSPRCEARPFHLNKKQKKKKHPNPSSGTELTRRRQRWMAWTASGGSVRCIEDHHPSGCLRKQGTCPACRTPHLPSAMPPWHCEGLLPQCPSSRQRWSPSWPRTRHWRRNSPRLLRWPPAWTYPRLHGNHRSFGRRETRRRARSGTESVEEMAVL